MLLCRLIKHRLQWSAVSAFWWLTNIWVVVISIMWTILCGKAELPLSSQALIRVSAAWPRLLRMPCNHLCFNAAIYSVFGIFWWIYITVPTATRRCSWWSWARFSSLWRTLTRKLTSFGVQSKAIASKTKPRSPYRHRDSACHIIHS